MDDPLAPGLDADRPELVDRAWPAFAACSGAEPPTFESIVFQRGEIGPDGKAELHGQRITVTLGDTAYVEFVALHELAHFWVDWDDRALEEGFASTLAECAIRRLHDTPDYRLFPALGPGFPWFDRLVQWDTDEGLDRSEVGMRYAAAHELAIRLEAALSPEQRWNPHVRRSWTDLWQMLRDAPGDTAFASFEVLAVAIATTDVDEDGLTGIQEAILGTDPLRFDTDGDGWWDGADPPPGAIAVPAEPSCLGVAEADGVLTVVGGTPDERLVFPPVEIPVVPGAPVVLGHAPAARTWWVMDGPPLAPCGTAPAQAGSWPMSEVEADGDGLVEAVERARGTDPNHYDTDGDGWWDGAEPPADVVPFPGTALTCLDVARWGWSTREIPVAGPEGDAGRARIVSDRGPEWRNPEVTGLWTVGPSPLRAWLPRLSDPSRRCERFHPIAQSGRLCLGTPTSARRVSYTMFGEGHGIEVERLLVDGLPRPADAVIRPGERIEVDVALATPDRYAWLRTNARLDPCPP